MAAKFLIFSTLYTLLYDYHKTYLFTEYMSHQHTQIDIHTHTPWVETSKTPLVVWMNSNTADKPSPMISENKIATHVYIILLPCAQVICRKAQTPHLAQRREGWRRTVVESVES